MANALLLTDTLETQAMTPQERNSKLNDFCDLVDRFHKQVVSLYTELSLYYRPYSYGFFYADFLYASWNEIKQKPTLNGIEQITYQRLINLANHHPALGASLQEKDWESLSFPRCKYGLSKSYSDAEYVDTATKWEQMRATYYREHQRQYLWNSDDDCFLPNVVYSNEILLKEIKKDPDAYNVYIDEYKSKNNKSTAIGIAFHEVLMKRKGKDIVAFALFIGTQICEANYYVYERDLSKQEQKAASGSLRAIFSMIGKNSKIQYISLDFKHGMFEYYDHNGCHLGEYRYNGINNSIAESSHNLKTL